ncbi:NAD(P)H-dependent flavin oxidoreductase [Sphingobium sp.]|uniref:NAD(P)H-dependent flavin oxidoreductase n=1 Tax=Sphingobium sp. TaxID=1912891 RepID=UPI003BB59A74
MPGLPILEMQAQLRLPIIIAPMFLVSTPEMVVAAAQNGVIGTYLAPNARTIEAFEAGLEQIVAGLPNAKAPWAASMIVHPTYDRFAAELERICTFKPPVVITALGSPVRLLAQIHAYGGAVFCDVATPDQARKAAAAGVDGLILLGSGAGGHTGSYSAFAFIEEVREFWDGPLVLAGAIGTAQGLRAALELGADFVYMGTRFLASRESMVSDEHRAMMVASNLSDIVTTSVPTGLPANWIKASLDAAGLSYANGKGKERADFSTLRDEVKAWKHIWSAGHSVGRTKAVESVGEIVDGLARDFVACAAEDRLRSWNSKLGGLSEAAVHN